LLIDLDPQGNATMGSGIDKNALSTSVYEVLLDEVVPDHAAVYSETGQYDVWPSNRELSGADLHLAELDDRELRLKKAIEEVREAYDFVLIDCPPSLSLLTLNGLAAADGVIVPMQCEYFALEGLSDLMNTIRRVHHNINPDLKMVGLLRVMFDTRITLQQQVSSQIETHFGDKVFTTIIPRNVRLAEAPSHGQPGIQYDKRSRGAKAYQAFGKEMLSLLQKLKLKARIQPLRHE